MKQKAQPIRKFLFVATITMLWLHLFSSAIKAQNVMDKVIVNGQILAAETIQQLETKYRIKCVPGNYWYDKMTGAFGNEGGPCVGILIAGLQIGGELKANASAGTTNVFINGRELNQLDVQGLQTFVRVVPGRYWMDAYGNFGYENSPAVGNLYWLYQAKFANKGSSYHKNNPYGGQMDFVSDGQGNAFFSSKGSDGRTVEASTGY